MQGYASAVDGHFQIRAAVKHRRGKQATKMVLSKYLGVETSTSCDSLSQYAVLPKSAFLASASVLELTTVDFTRAGTLNVMQQLRELARMRHAAAAFCEQVEPSGTLLLWL